MALALALALAVALALALALALATLASQYMRAELLRRRTGVRAQWHAALAARLGIAMRADFPREGARLFSRAPRRFALAAQHVSLDK